MHNTSSSDDHILVVQDLVVGFPNKATGSRKEVLHGVSLSLKQGEVLGLVGESGSGKSVFSRSLLRLESPAEIISGSILLDGQELTTKSPREMRAFRGEKIAMVMQDPRNAMDPVFTLGNQFREVISMHKAPGEGKGRGKADPLRGTYELLKSVGIASPEERCRQYPNEWSRGMLQRALVVMAFCSSPKVLILDEVTSALDPTVSLQILDMIVRLKEEHDAGIILITHDLSVTLEVCDRVTVLQKGSIVETGAVREIFDHPVDPYTSLLVSGMNGDDSRKDQ
ncbi:MAG: hypothetical protein BAW33_00860 [Desulfobacterales bacterium C00003104]|nr:MAG: hypothetical protein BAW33_00860 [Desulfobacterales bacterium C00003104]